MRTQELFDYLLDMRTQELFDYMSREHGLTLLESEMHEIELIIARMLEADRKWEDAHKCPACDDTGWKFQHLTLGTNKVKCHCQQ